ncbi:hypothetical protein [Clostridium aciditolerans]|uniref:Uncharacterized protein n=1 Tax=Clostridium aciditolerans TaxID=339861 RepID=A0A934HPQ9_9CLOT|nr:hypothetical protein [Clostridium aciditolerans]MBI6872075.1 hypothetical protein [Clostridium aciditolerans]
MANKKKKVKDKQREKNKIRKAKVLVKAFFEEKKKETITYILKKQILMKYLRSLKTKISKFLMLPHKLQL